MLPPVKTRKVVRLLVVALLLAVAIAPHAQPAAKVYRIGFLGTTSPKSHGAFMDSFREGLRERGYIEGKNVTIEYRWAESDYGRLPALAAELVQLNVDLILTHGTPGARAAKEATTTIPIVVAIAGDAVATGLVSSLARPGGNLTGSTFFFPELNAKRLEMLKEALPSLKRVAVLLNDDNRGNVVTFDAMTKTARSVNVEVVQVATRNPDDFERAFAQIARSGAQAVVGVRGRALPCPGRASGGSGGTASAPQHRLPGVRGRGWPPRVRCRLPGRLASRRWFRGPDLQGCSAGGYPHAAAGEIRHGRQPPDRQGSPAHDSPKGLATCRQGDRTVRAARRVGRR